MMMTIANIPEPPVLHRRCASEDNVKFAAQAKRHQPRRNSESDAQPAKKRSRVRIQLEPQFVDPEPLPPKTCWYSKQDLLHSRKTARRLSRQVNTDSVLMETYDRACKLADHDDHNTAEEIMAMLEGSDAYWKQRGLERLSQKHAISRSIQVCSVKSAVLLEQISQNLDGIKDPERLAEASLMASRPSQHFAQLLALADQAMARRIHSEPTDFLEQNTPVAPTA
jgi:hypothetical protein